MRYFFMCKNLSENYEMFLIIQFNLFCRKDRIPSPTKEGLQHLFKQQNYLLKILKLPRYEKNAMIRRS